MWPVTLSLARESHHLSQPPGLPGPPTMKDQSSVSVLVWDVRDLSVGLLSLLTLLKDIYKFILSTGAFPGVRQQSPDD